MAATFDPSVLGQPTTLFVIGLRSGQGKYITVETFGDQVSKKKKFGLKNTNAIFAFRIFFFYFDYEFFFFFSFEN